MGTLDSFFGDATRGDGRKFKQRHWQDHQYVEPIFKPVGSKLWCGVNHNGAYTNEDGASPDCWAEWHPPKEKIVRWFWADDSGRVSGNLMSDAEQKDFVKGFNIKLEWSRTEFDDHPQKQPHPRSRFRSRIL